MSGALLRVADLETWYGPVCAIRGLTFDVAASRIVTVLGANGAGKTTLLNTIAGVIDPRKGSVTFDGRPIQGWDPDRVARAGVVLVPEGRQVFPFLSVRENLMMGSIARADKSGLGDTLAMVYQFFPRLKEREHQHGGLLSGGEQQMLAIGRALMAAPRLLLLDEPSLGLSPLFTQEIFAIVRRINAEAGVTIVVIEQNAAVALATAHEGYVLELGRIAASGTAAELAAKEDIKEAYLGVGAHGQAERGQRRRRSSSWL